MLAEKTQKSLIEINSNVSIVIQRVKESSSAIKENRENILDLTQNTFKINDILKESKIKTEENIASSKAIYDNVYSVLKNIENLNEEVSSTEKLSEGINIKSNKLVSITNEMDTNLNLLQEELKEFKI